MPSEEGISRAMRMALDQSGLMAAEIDYLSAHATSTPAGDAAEAANIRKIFGAKTPPTSSLKSMTGHELWMSGASQVVYSTIMAQQKFIAANINFHKPSRETSGLNIIRETIPEPPRRFFVILPVLAGQTRPSFWTFPDCYELRLYRHRIRPLRSDLCVVAGPEWTAGVDP